MIYVAVALFLSLQLVGVAITWDHDRPWLSIGWVIVVTGAACITLAALSV